MAARVARGTLAVVFSSPFRMPRRVGAALVLVSAVTLIGVPVSASSPAPTPAPSGDPASKVQQDQQALQHAHDQAVAADTLLGKTRADLAAARAQLNSLRQRISASDKRIAANTARLKELQRQENADRAYLAGFMRIGYERGTTANFAYIVSAPDFGSLMRRQEAASEVTKSTKALVQRIAAGRAEAQALLARSVDERNQLGVLQEQAMATEALVTAEEHNVAIADHAAWDAVAHTQDELKAALAAQAALDAAKAALAYARSHGVIFSAIPGINFTIDTDLTQPSGETADKLNKFLAGTALQGLGQAFMDAEAKHHVSARYLLAHAIEESAFGTSAIAQQKHNLFGYGADDTHPFEDAYSFKSFAECIDFVATKVAENYLDPKGPYFHGPTLRGMNVSYASDPNWSANIAKIANSFV
jgi:beta-N-acetylglucosaminidase